MSMIAGIFGNGAAWRALAALMVIGLAGHSAAAQEAESLDHLFERLANAPSQRAAYEVEQTIWGIWLHAPDPRANRLLHEARGAATSGNLVFALDSFNALVEEYPDFAEGWNQRAIMQYLRGDIEQSLEDIARALALEPRHFGALAGRGQCYLLLERPQAALAAFEAALVAHPWLPAARQQVELLRRYLDKQQTPI